MVGTGDPQSHAALREWLSLRVAGYLERPADNVRTDVSFAECGLDSMYALMLCGDIEDNLGVPMEPKVAWDHRTIDSLAGYLAQQLGCAAP